MTKIATHSGGFHSDDVCTIAMLLLMYPDAEVVRTRDPAVLADADFVVDVGTVYDPEKNRFDHHQEGGAGNRDNGVPYASFGLVWKKFGAEFCESQDVADIVERKLVTPIDAFDNGVDLVTPRIEGVHPYRIDQFFFSMEPTWLEQKEGKTIDQAFYESVSIAQVLLKREIAQARAEIEALHVIEDMYDSSEEKEIILIDEQYMFDRRLLIQAFTSHPDVIYIVRKHEGGTWQVVAAVDDIYSFDKRKALPESWAGKSGKDLADISGVEDAMFCHNKLFMCITRTQEGALVLAHKALTA